MDVLAEILPEEEAANIILDYARRYPWIIRALAKIVGYQVGEGEVDYRKFAKVVPIVALNVVAPTVAG